MTKSKSLQGIRLVSHEVYEKASTRVSKFLSQCLPPDRFAYAGASSGQSMTSLPSSLFGKGSNILMMSSLGSDPDIPAFEPAQPPQASESRPVGNTPQIPDGDVLETPQPQTPGVPRRLKSSLPRKAFSLLKYPIQHPILASLYLLGTDLAIRILGVGYDVMGGQPILLKQKGDELSTFSKPFVDTWADIKSVFFGVKDFLMLSPIGNLVLPAVYGIYKSINLWKGRNIELSALDQSYNGLLSTHDIPQEGVNCVVDPLFRSRSSSISLLSVWGQVNILGQTATLLCAIRAVSTFPEMKVIAEAGYQIQNAQDIGGFIVAGLLTFASGKLLRWRQGVSSRDFTIGLANLEFPRRSVGSRQPPAVGGIFGGDQERTFDDDGSGSKQTTMPTIADVQRILADGRFDPVERIRSACEMAGQIAQSDERSGKLAFGAILSVVQSIPDINPEFIAGLRTKAF
ncbi:MAG: hypothetical protein ABII22_00015 [Candidatus Micrarchaeota archaeon]